MFQVCRIVLTQQWWGTALKMARRLQLNLNKACLWLLFTIVNLNSSIGKIFLFDCYHDGCEFPAPWDIFGFSL